MSAMESGTFRLINSGEFNAALWAARASSDEELADHLLSEGDWEPTGDGRLTRAAEISGANSERVAYLLRGVSSGKIAVHESHIPPADAALERHGLDV